MCFLSACFFSWCMFMTVTKMDFCVPTSPLDSLLPWLVLSSRMFDHFSGAMHHFKALFLVSGLNSMAGMYWNGLMTPLSLAQINSITCETEDQLLSKQTLGDTGMGLGGGGAGNVLEEPSAQ
ncbi:hypothetical protein HJG60_011601 [Phyllostomus discolor]|uniref:Uncharacterized protein n=1 Tax=Phyllostomus discolor TaxID=89673 RepID=A0A834E1A4_9CHIR|nr:hypothetical protein HJG60_011601 [Phyllostomus discolor]